MTTVAHFITDNNCKYIFVGNNTYMGFTVCEYLNSSKLTSAHIYFPRQTKRCKSNEYFTGHPPSWVFEISSYDQFVAELKHIKLKCSKLRFFCTGEIESALLCKLKISHSWIIDGSDFTENLFWQDQHSSKIRNIIQSNPYIEVVYGSQTDHAHSARILGLSDKISLDYLYMPPIKLVNNIKMLKQELQIKQEKLCSKNINSKLLVLSPARRVYSDNPNQYSKGTEHIVEFFKYLDMFNVNILATVSGPDSLRFQEDVKSICSSKIKLISHLSQLHLHRLMTSYHKVILLDQFGYSERVFSGLFREAICLGCLTITNLDLRDIVLDENKLMYRAKNTEQIISCFEQIHAMNDYEFIDRQLETLSEAEKIFNINEFNRRLGIIDS